MNIILYYINIIQKENIKKYSHEKCNNILHNNQTTERKTESVKNVICAKKLNNSNNGSA